LKIRGRDGWLPYLDSNVVPSACFFGSRSVGEERFVCGAKKNYPCTDPDGPCISRHAIAAIGSTSRDSTKRGAGSVPGKRALGGSPVDLYLRRRRSITAGDARGHWAEISHAQCRHTDGQAAGHAIQVHSFESKLHVVREFFCRVAARPLQIAVATGTRLLAVVNPTVSLKIMYSGNHQSGALHVPDKVKEQRARVQDAVMHGSGSICRSSSPLHS
jgi:hypothetical protein